MTKKTTAQKVIEYLERYSLRQEGDNYRCNRPWSNGSDSMGLLFGITDGEHGWFEDFVAGETGSLYELAEKLDIETPSTHQPQAPKVYNLESYAFQKGVDKSAFLRAGWVETIKKERPAAKFSTPGGERFRYLDEKTPKFWHYNHKACFYGLDDAIALANNRNRHLVLCNGEPSVVVAHYFGIPAFCISGGESRNIKPELMQELKDKWQGIIIIALDDDSTGLAATVKKYRRLEKEGFEVKQVDFRQATFLTDKGYDLADLCKNENEKTYELLCHSDGYDLDLAQKAIKIKSSHCMDIYRELKLTKIVAIKETKQQAVGDLSQLKNSQMEHEFLGAVFARFDPVLFDEISLKSTDLTEPILAPLYSVMCNIFKNKHHDLTTDPTTLYEIIKRSPNSLMARKFKSKDGLSEFISNLVINIGVLDSEQVKQMCIILKEYSNRRRLATEFKIGLDNSLDLKKPLPEVIKKVELKLNEISLSNGNHNPLRTSEVEASEYLERLEENMQKGGVSFFPLPIRKLNESLNGLQRGQMSLLAAESGMGKTSFLIYMALVGAMQGKRSLIFSIEMTREQLMHRFVSLMTALNNEHVPKNRLSLAILNDGDYPKVLKATSDFSGLPLTIIDRKDIGSDASVKNIRNLTKKAINEHGKFDLVGVDSLRKIEFRNPKMTNVDGMPDNILQFEAMTKELDTHGMMLHHLNKSGYGGIPSQKNLEYIKGEDQDIILLMYREGKHDDMVDPTQTKFIIAKNRDGEEKTVDANFNLTTGQFSNVVVDTIPLNPTAF